MWQIFLNCHQRMGMLPLKKRVNRDKCSFPTKQRMFGVFAIDEILRYRGTRFPGSRTLCHPAWIEYAFWHCGVKIIHILPQLSSSLWSTQLRWFKKTNKSWTFWVRDTPPSPLPSPFLAPQYMGYDLYHPIQSTTQTLESLLAHYLLYFPTPDDPSSHNRIVCSYRVWVHAV